MKEPLQRVLFIDDEPRVLDGLRRQLHGLFEVVTTTSPGEAIAILTDDPPPVIVSDYAMPEINGAVLLAHAREVAPDTARVLLTGQADLAGAMAAVNEGRILRFLLKPASFDEITGALFAGIEQHRLVTSERVLLEQTLRGSVQALVETLSLANPGAFARSNRVHQLAVRMLDALDVPDRWAVEIAALLAQLGAVTLPPTVVEKLGVGAALSPAETAMVDQVPTYTKQILASIPRLEAVQAILAHLAGEPARGEVGLGARLLLLATDWEALSSSGMDVGEAMHALHGRHGSADQPLMRVLAELVSETEGDEVVVVRLDELRPGMTLAEDLCTAEGVLLVPRGNEVTPAVVARVRNFGTVAAGTPDVIKVITPRSLLPAAAR